MKKTICKLGLGVFIWGVLVAFFNWLCVPTLSFNFFSGSIFIALSVLSLAFTIFGILKFEDRLEEINGFAVVGSVIGISLLLALIIPIAGSSLFHSTQKQSMLGEVLESEFSEEIIPLQDEGIPVVDIELAQKQADKTLGSISGLGSQVKIGEFTLQQVSGELIYVAPLEHSGFFKWKDNGTTSGYITVSATDSTDVELVQSVNNSNIELKYLSSSCFDEDLVRYVKNSGYKTVGLTDYSFELDDEGNPFYVITMYENTILWGTPEVTGVLILDAQTGEINEYTVEETPEWVDRIYPEDFVSDQIYNWGTLVHGVFNFSDKDKITKTDDMIIVYIDNECYYYTGLTSVGTDESVVGFMMVNTRTKEVTKFTMSGATESAAMKSAEGLVQDMGYTATIPVPINLDGEPTYFLTLKDSEGLIKSYALVNISNYSIAVQGATIAEAKRNYASALVSSGNNNSLSSSNTVYEELEGIITRISANTENGSTSYYFVLDDNMEVFYVASYNISEELPLTREGDLVEISYKDTNLEGVTVVTFDNQNIGG